MNEDSSRTPTVASPISDLSPRVSAASQPVGRFPSVDVLRGLVMFVMLVVNDVGGVPAVPKWLKHFEPALGNGMTIADWVFPAFLFVVGLSVPLAVEGRRTRGEPTWRTAGHIVLRAVWLLLLGVVMVNFRGWGWWPVLATVASVLAFLSVRSWPASLGLAVRCVGFAGLAALLLTYPRFEPHMTLKTQWWGILGLIGWAYLAAGLAYIAVGRSRPLLVAATALCVGLFFTANQTKFGDPLAIMKPWVDPGSVFGTHAAVTLAGVILGTGLLPTASERGHRDRVRLALAVAAVCAAGALATYPAYGVNKNLATPAWALACAGLTSLLWAAVYLATEDGRPGRIGMAVSTLLAGVGGNALLAYLIQPLWFRGLSLAKISYGSFGSGPATGVVRGLIAAAVICLLTALLYRRGVRLRL